MTPSFIGRMACMLPGVRPIISRASSPTATIRLSSPTATTEGSVMTMPLPLTYTITFAVPRSIPIFMTAGCYSGVRRGHAHAGTTRRVGGRERSGGVGRPDDARPELLELAVDVLIPPLDVVRAVDERRAVGGEGRENQRGAGAQVADRDLRAAQPGGAVDGRVVRVLDVDVGAQLAQL